MKTLSATREAKDSTAAIWVGKYSPTLRLTIILGAALVSWLAFAAFAWFFVLHLA
jgi:hypothetical protein